MPREEQWKRERKRHRVASLQNRNTICQLVAMKDLCGGYPVSSSCFLMKFICGMVLKALQGTSVGENISLSKTVML